MGRRCEVQDGTFVATPALQPWLWARNPTSTTPHTGRSAPSLLQGYIYTTPLPSPPPCPSPPYTITYSAGHPPFLPSLTTVHLLPIQPPTQMDTIISDFLTSISAPPGSPATPQPQLERPTRGAWSPSMVRNGRLRLILISSSKPQLVTSSPTPLQRLRTRPAPEGGGRGARNPCQPQRACNGSLPLPCRPCRR
jgi:hypothetical protein